MKIDIVNLYNFSKLLCVLIVVSLFLLILSVSIIYYLFFCVIVSTSDRMHLIINKCIQRHSTLYNHVQNDPFIKTVKNIFCFF